MKIHPLTWLIAVLLIGIIFWFGVSEEYSLDAITSHALTDDDNENKSKMTDRDNAAEEVRAVATKITNLEQTIENLNSGNRSERNRIRSEFQEMYNEVRNAMEIHSEHKPNQEITDAVNTLSSRMQRLERQQQYNREELEPIPESSPNFVWHFPEDISSSDMLDSAFEGEFLAASVRPAVTDVPATKTDISKFTPHYTIPPTTTLLNATALTALVGRIPVKGKIQDPWRFKIIIGSDNLAANGHIIPQLAGMLWAGTARGDLSLSCVSGNVDTATFIFSDGSIQTARSLANSDSSTTGLGWISDEFGNPCIGGELKSNALQFLTQSTLVDTTKATADALANAQTESNFDARTGESSTSVVGNIDKFIAGYATKESLTEVSQWLKDRQLNSFDAIYVPAGKAVAIHVEQPVLIDHEPSGRKVIQSSYDVPITSAIHGWFD